MAEILIRLGDTHPDPKAWQRLYPVAVKPNGWAWGVKETWPDFAKLRITDLTVAQAEDYLLDDGADVTCPRCAGTGIDPVADPKTGINGPCTQCSGKGTIWQQSTLRKWKFDLDDVTLPKAMLTKVKAGQVVVATKAQVVAFIKRTLA